MTTAQLRAVVLSLETPDTRQPTPKKVHPAWSSEALLLLWTEQRVRNAGTPERSGAEEESLAAPQKLEKQNWKPRGEAQILPLRWRDGAGVTGNGGRRGSVTRAFNAGNLHARLSTPAPPELCAAAQHLRIR